MESNNKPLNRQQDIDSKQRYQQVLRQIKLINRKSALLKSNQDTDNLDFDGRI